MTKTITSANAAIFLSVTGLFVAPVRLQGFAADDIFDTEGVEPAEVQMGVDGRMSAGFINREVKWNVTLQADSPSIDMFETWLSAEKAAQDILFATGTVTLPGVGKTYAMTRGVLMSYPSMSGAKKVLQPRRFAITWEDVSPAAI